LFRSTEQALPERIMKSAILPLLLLLGACAAPAPRSADQQQQDATNAACRQEAERVMRFRDRGQLMRQDEPESRLGSGAFSGATTGSMSPDRLSSRFQQDRMIDECVRGANEAPPATTGAGRGS
jgi:hypothetical protein